MATPVTILAPTNALLAIPIDGVVAVVVGAGAATGGRTTGGGAVADEAPPEGVVGAMGGTTGRLRGLLGAPMNDVSAVEPLPMELGKLVMLVEPRLDVKDVRVISDTSTPVVAAGSSEIRAYPVDLPPPNHPLMVLPIFPIISEVAVVRPDEGVVVRPDEGVVDTSGLDSD